MGEQIHVYDLTIFGERLGKIERALVLLNLFIQIKDKLNRVHVKKEKLAVVIEKSYRTVSDYIKILAENGAIKYTYSGSVRLNPFFSFDGTAADYNEAVREWFAFRSDIPALKLEYIQSPKLA